MLCCGHYSRDHDCLHCHSRGRGWTIALFHAAADSFFACTGELAAVLPCMSFALQARTAHSVVTGAADTAAAVAVAVVLDAAERINIMLFI